MPSQVDIKSLRPNSYYHVYTHAVGNERCFVDGADDYRFIELLRERVVPGVARNRGHACATFADQVSVVAFAFMANHLHLLLHQRGDPAAIANLMRNLLWAYTMSFNQRHRREGGLFIKPYNVRHLANADDVMNEIAYIHFNPRKPGLIDQRTSHLDYTGAAARDLVAVEHGMRFFGNPAGYARFFDNYTALKRTRETARRNIPM